MNRKTVARIRFVAPVKGEHKEIMHLPEHRPSTSKSQLPKGSLKTKFCGHISGNGRPLLQRMYPWHSYGWGYTPSILFWQNTSEDKCRGMINESVEFQIGSDDESFTNFNLLLCFNNHGWSLMVSGLICKGVRTRRANSRSERAVTSPQALPIVKVTCLLVWVIIEAICTGWPVWVASWAEDVWPAVIGGCMDAPIRFMGAEVIQIWNHMVKTDWVSPLDSFGGTDWPPICLFGLLARLEFTRVTKRASLQKSITDDWGSPLVHTVWHDGTSGISSISTGDMLAFWWLWLLCKHPFITAGNPCHCCLRSLIWCWAMLYHKQN